ncbi:hypothetical protein AMS57_15285 [Pseudoalteromonas undina]|uniref:hypothetical protein n=1 Tax=Pseudoalteromonas undina TaxID=43660 RepID=UPI0006BAFADF|nr:hypothetical protein [Pseudoalteromonas undina]KPH89761.1 hypothetical protein AMS57_15285 [Pseudoalteromonas undina]
MPIKNKEKNKNYCKVIELNKVDSIYKLQINLTLRNWLVLIFLIFPSHLDGSKVEHISQAISSLGVLQSE